MCYFNRTVFQFVGPSTAFLPLFRSRHIYYKTAADSCTVNMSKIYIPTSLVTIYNHHMCKLRRYSFRPPCLSPRKIMKATCHFKKHKLTCRCSQQDGCRHSGPRGRSSCKCYYDDVRAQKAWRLFSVMNGQQQPAVTVYPPQCTSMANAISHFTVTHTQTFIQTHTQTSSRAGMHTQAHSLSSSLYCIPWFVGRGTSPADTVACVFYDI